MESHLTYETQIGAGEKLVLPPHFFDKIGPGRWRVTVEPVNGASIPSRDHSAFLKGYCPEDEGLYDDCPAR